MFNLDILFILRILPGVPWDVRKEQCKAPRGLSARALCIEVPVMGLLFFSFQPIDKTISTV